MSTNKFRDASGLVYFQNTKDGSWYLPTPQQVADEVARTEGRKPIPLGIEPVRRSLTPGQERQAEMSWSRQTNEGILQVARWHQQGVPSEAEQERLMRDEQHLRDIEFNRQIARGGAHTGNTAPLPSTTKPFQPPVQQPWLRSTAIDWLWGGKPELNRTPDAAALNITGYTPEQLQQREAAWQGGQGDVAIQSMLRAAAVRKGMAAEVADVKFPQARNKSTGYSAEVKQGATVASQMSAEDIAYA
jgi:hypothetical protein